jgi:hypothetical protein
MRGLGKNMASAYSLLPSKEYFTKIFTPTIAFASTTVIGVNNGSYPLSINSSENQSAFVTDINNSREDPPTNDTSKPIRANNYLLMATDVFRGIIDPFSWPANLARWSILGLNVNTTSGITYSNKKLCLIQYIGLPCAESLVHILNNTIMGDGTVIAPSASYNSGTIVSVDLAVDSKNNNTNISHSNILESSTTQATIKEIIKNGSQNNIATSTRIISNITAVTIGEPDYSKEAISLVLSTHSPVELHIYDSKGNHTGLINKPVELANNDFISAMYETKIPGSSFEMSEAIDGNETYIHLPNNTGEEYKVSIYGTDLGYATFNIEKKKGAQTLDSLEYSMFPVTPLTVASTSVFADSSDGIAKSLSINSPALSIDTDGNGIADILATSSVLFNEPSVASTMETLKKLVETLTAGNSQGKQLIKKIDRFISLASEGKLKPAKRQATLLEKSIGHKNLKNISNEDKRKILDMIESIILVLEEGQIN